MSTGYATGTERSLRVDSGVLGQVQPWEVVHRGLVYPGEVVVAERVNPDWGRPLEGDACFRVVLYTVPRRIPPAQIADPRIAMAVPRRSIEPERQSVSLEIHAIRETRERYVTGAVPEAMAERESSLLNELVERETLAYSQGRVYTRGSTAIRPAEVFVGDGAGTWVDRLATELLSQAFPALPFQSERLPETLTAEMMGTIFRGLFQGEPDAAAAAAAFGPALGLTQPEAPTRLDASGCRVLDVMARELESRGGEVSSQDLLWSMCRYHGLNRALATLYLVAFVRRERAEVELVPEHSVQQTAGGPFQSDRVTWDLVPELAYTASLAGQLGALRAKPLLAWNAVLPYANLLVERPGHFPRRDTGRRTRAAAPGSSRKAGSAY